MKVLPTASGVVTGVVPSLSSACLLIATSATGPITWLKVAVLLVWAGSPVFEVTVAASEIAWPAVPAATVPMIVICGGGLVTGSVGASDASMQTTVPPGPPGSVQSNPLPTAVAVNWLGRESLTTTPSAVLGPSLETVSVYVVVAP